MKNALILFSVIVGVFSCKTVSPSTVKSEKAVEKFSCVDSSGDRKLLVERSLDNELPFPTYNIDFQFKGKTVVRVDDALVARESETEFMVQKVTEVDGRRDIQVSAGIHWSKGKASGFYVEAANGGMSPLPGTDFEICDVSSPRFK